MNTNYIRNAAIILMYLGDQTAAAVLKSFDKEQVNLIIAELENIGHVSQEELNKATKAFLIEIETGTQFGCESREAFKSKVIQTLKQSSEENSFLEDDRFDVIRSLSESKIAYMLGDEHPQIITAFIVILYNHVSPEFGSKVLSLLPKKLQTDVIKRMTLVKSISKLGMEIILDCFGHRADNSTFNENEIEIDGIESLANIISSLDTDTEHRVVNALISKNKQLGEKIQERIFPFERLAELDKRSLQTLLAEISSDDIVIALKGCDERIKTAFFQSMSTKAAEIIKDELESKGPVKLAVVKDVQKKIIKIAKKLESEEKIFLTSKNNSDVIM